MSEKEFKFPAKRIIEFNEDDFRTNDQITLFSESLITDKDWLDFAENALTFTDGNVIYRYAEEYPIVVYKCSDKVKLMPSNRLNSFIEKIIVSSADYGTCFSIATGKMQERKIGLKTVVYFKDNIGGYYAVPQHDIIKLLLKKPKLIVSKEGLLVFYTQDEILATSDCLHYAWIHDIDTEHAVITDIRAFEDYCKVYLNDTVKHGEYPPIRYEYKINFNIDMTDSGMIIPTVSHCNTIIPHEYR